MAKVELRGAPHDRCPAHPGVGQIRLTRKEGSYILLARNVFYIRHTFFIEVSGGSAYM
jgi:hypothetical protein